MIRDERRLYVHAGIVPGVPLNEQPREALLWIRDEFLSSDADHGFLVVHGHTPVESCFPDLRRNRLNLDTGACFGGPCMVTPIWAYRAGIRCAASGT